MSQFEVADEAIGTLWDGLALELEQFAPSRSAARTVLKVARRDFLHMLANFPQHVIAGVTDIAPGTGVPVLRIVVSDRYKSHAAFAAKRRMKTTAH